jgi:methyltransferase (TIGR00027 family)
MTNQSEQLQNVSDTALWVAFYRGQESEKPNALFHDPFALELAGERGKKIAAKIGYSDFMSWMMAVRTIAIDELVEKSINEGVDAVLNLGAGLDARPYRLKLPQELHWIEADFPHMISYKRNVLDSKQPHCHLEHVEIDLSNRKQAQALFQSLNKEYKKILVITEGVIPYLTNEQAQMLAEDLYAQDHFTFWIQDFRNGGFVKRIPRSLKKSMQATPFRFTALDWFEFFGKLHWKSKDVLYSTDLGKQHGRPLPLPWFVKPLVKLLSQKKIESFRKSAGYVRMERVGN